MLLGGSLGSSPRSSGFTRHFSNLRDPERQNCSRRWAAFGVEQYDLLGEGFPATQTEDGELQISLRPTPAHADKAGNLVNLLDHYLSCHRAGETYWGPQLRIVLAGARWRRT
jgi:hypothetical protein